MSSWLYKCRVFPSVSFKINSLIPNRLFCEVPIMLTFIQQSLPQNSPNLDYTASYYAHVNGSGASGQKAVLISRITFKGSDTSQDLISTLYFTLHYNIQKIYFAIITKNRFFWQNICTLYVKHNWPQRLYIYLSFIVQENKARLRRYTTWLFIAIHIWVEAKRQNLKDKTKMIVLTVGC